MRIVVCGWYYRDDFLRSLWRVKERYPVMVVAHRDHPMLQKCDLPYTLAENKGLEWGAYSHYVMNLWPENDAVLFCHDDIKLRPLLSADYEIIYPERVLEKIELIPYDQAYIFQGRSEDVINCGTHGRMVYFSERMLHLVKRHRGFPFDCQNMGYTGPGGVGENPENVLSANVGMMYVHEMMEKMQELRPAWTISKIVYMPSIEMGYRGHFEEAKERYIGEHLNERIMGYENKNLCMECGGDCCKRMPGPTFPQDFNNANHDRLSQSLKSGKWAVDFLDADGLKEPDGTEKNRAFFIRPAIKGRPELFDTGIRGECIFLKKNGCELAFDDRPNACRNMEPKEGRNCVQHGATVRSSALAWMPFKGMIEKIAEEILGSK